MSQRKFIDYRGLKGEYKIPLLNEAGNVIGETSLDQLRFWINKENKK